MRRLRLTEKQRLTVLKALADLAGVYAHNAVKAKAGAEHEAFMNLYHHVNRVRDKVLRYQPQESKVWQAVGCYKRGSTPTDGERWRDLVKLNRTLYNGERVL